MFAKFFVMLKNFKIKCNFNFFLVELYKYLRSFSNLYLSFISLFISNLHYDLTII